MKLQISDCSFQIEIRLIGTICNKSTICNLKSATSNVRLNAVAVTDRLGMRAAGGARRTSAAHPLDHAFQIAVADRFAMFAHADDRVINLAELVGRQHEPENLAPALDGVAAGVAAEHELLGG